MKARARLRLDYAPHAGQAAVHRAFDDGARFVVGACGRRWGKSHAARQECIRRALRQPGTVIRWASPVYSQSKARFRELLREARSLGPDYIASTNKSELRIEFRNGSEIQFWSTHEPDNLRGEGVHFLVVDEAGYVHANVWTETLRPMLSDTLGGALIIGTPRGRGQFLHQSFVRGQSGARGWHSIHAPTWSSPRIEAEEIEAARSELPADAFAQEYGADFLESAAGVFRGIAGCIAGALEGPRPGRRYVVGVDLAQTRDFSVLLTLEAQRRQVVDLQRFQGVSYVEQVNRIIATARRYNDAHVVVDASGVGLPVLDNLRASLGRFRGESELDRRGGRLLRSPRVTGVTLTQAVKQDLVQKLQLEIERARVRIPAECEVLLRELEVYGYEMTRTGRVSYSAPSGFHDDSVIALALASFGIPREVAAWNHVDPRWRGVIEQLRERVAFPRRFGLRSHPVEMVGPFVVPPRATDLVAEWRLAQVCREAGLLAEDEAELLIADVRRRVFQLGGSVPSYTDSLDAEPGFGRWSQFVQGES